MSPAVRLCISLGLVLCLAEGVAQADAAKESPFDAVQVQKEGLTVVDLRDEWVPYIFRDAPAPDGQGVLQSRYKSVFLGMADDTGDGDGQPLQPGEHNYLELYGVPPTLRVLHERFLEDAAAADRCKDVDNEILKSVIYIPFREGKIAEKEAQKIAASGLKLELERKKRKLETIDQLVDDPKLGPEVVTFNKFQQERKAFAEAEKRLACEGLFDKKYRHETGKFDESLRIALVRFQRKHKLYDAAAFKKETMATLQHTMLENDHAALMRVLTERVVSAADVLEDGSTDRKDGPPKYKDEKGEMVPVRNMVDECVKALLTALDIDTPDKALLWMQKHASFKDLEVALKLPDRPAYYTPMMDLSVEVDRGDVFYDVPFDEKGKAVDQSRHHFPMFTLRVRYNGQLIPLVRWRTTIGGWRSDLASNGYEYFRYKGSDVGPRVWRNIVAGPVWIAPNSTPIRTLVKYKNVNKTSQLVVNYDEVGPEVTCPRYADWSRPTTSCRAKTASPTGTTACACTAARKFFRSEIPTRTRTGLSPTDEPPRRAVVLVRAAPPDDDRRRREAAELRAAVLVEGRHLRDALAVHRAATTFTSSRRCPSASSRATSWSKLKKPITTYMPKPGVKYPPGPPPIPPDSPAARAGGQLMRALLIAFACLFVGACSHRWNARRDRRAVTHETKTEKAAFDAGTSQTPSANAVSAGSERGDAREAAGEREDHGAHEPLRRACGSTGARRSSA